MKKFFKIYTDRVEEVKDFEELKKIRKKSPNFNFKGLQYLGIGFSLITPIILGLVIGLLIKRVVFFIFLGMIFSFYNLYKITKE